jgi:hypothetical protein
MKALMTPADVSGRINPVVGEAFVFLRDRTGRLLEGAAD